MHEVYTSSHLVIERETLVIKEMQYSFVGDQNEVRLKPYKNYTPDVYL